MITGVFVSEAAGTVVVTWRFGAVVDGAAGTVVVVAGTVVTGTRDAEVSGAALDVGTAATCTEVGVTASDTLLDEQAARTVRPKEAARIGASTRVFMPLKCLNIEPMHALSRRMCEAQPGRVGRTWRIFTAVSTTSLDSD